MQSTKKFAPPTNETEARAKEIALVFERRRILALMGEDAVREIREVGAGNGYEIASPDGRTIEVKGTEGTDVNVGFILNSEQEFNHIMNGGFVYRITDVFGNLPRIYILTHEHLSIKQRFRADMRIRSGSTHEIVAHEEIFQA